MLDNNYLPEPTLKRLSIYYQYLCNLTDSNRKISCTDIAVSLNLTPIQVRKDLQLAGAQGKPKVGYIVKELIAVLEKCLGYDNINEAFLVGAGNFGQLVLNYGFHEYGIKILAAFDNNPAKIGKIINGIRVLSIDKFTNLADRMKVKIGIIAVTPDNAQKIADIMVNSKIEAVWNLTHTNIELPDDVIHVDVNLGSSLSILLSKLTAKYNK